MATKANRDAALAALRNVPPAPAPIAEQGAPAKAAKPKPEATEQMTLRPPVSMAKALRRMATEASTREDRIVSAQEIVLRLVAAGIAAEEGKSNG
jgi:hypothetical protein